MKNNKIRNIFLFILIALIGLIAAFLMYFNYLSKTSAGESQQKIIYNVDEGNSTWSIADSLKKNGFIKQSWALFFYIKVKRLTIKSGAYLLSEDMTMSEIAQKISDGNTVIRKITIIEGWRLEQIAQYLANEGYVDYQVFIDKAKSYEGKLYPDTYYISIESSEDEIINLMLENYRNRLSELTITNEDLIIASIVEREAKSDEQKADIAGVYHNRIKSRMKLESCPTVNYAYDSAQVGKLATTEAQKYQYWQNISFSLYHSVISGYNTYLNYGLPPAPISNPGIKSIEASVNYSKHDYLYFFHDNSGKIYLSKNSLEHEANKERYLK